MREQNWLFLSTHGLVLIEVARNPNLTVREIAEATGRTSRQVLRVLADLEEDGYVTRHRVGRRNRYRVNPQRPMRHATLAHQHVGRLLDLLSGR